MNEPREIENVSSWRTMYRRMCIWLMFARYLDFVKTVLAFHFVFTIHIVSRLIRSENFPAI